MANEIDFLFYNLPDDEGKVQVIIKDETIWATQKAMSQLFDVGVPDISKHLKKKFESGELDKDVVVSKMEITTQHGAIEGKTQVSETAFYSLDAIIAVGYRVSSARATKFRQWATKVLKEFIKIERENAFSMDQFAASVNEFLTFRRYALLPDKGKISREMADKKAEDEYMLFNPKQQIDSDFDKEVRGLFDDK